MAGAYHFIVSVSQVCELGDYLLPVACSDHRMTERSLAEVDADSDKYLLTKLIDVVAVDSISRPLR